MNTTKHFAAQIVISIIISFLFLTAPAFGMYGLKGDTAILIFSNHAELSTKNWFTHPANQVWNGIQNEIDKKQKDTITSDIHEIWDELLKKHVSKEGFVDYKGFKKNVSQLEKYLNLLTLTKPEVTDTKNKKLAYWINVYNAYTVKLILDNYPLKSIKEIKDPWGKRFFKIENQWYSLEDVEHKILRKMDEPRIHFAIVCASVSCPKLQNTAFVPQLLNEQLERATRAFLNDPVKNTITRERLELSLIFRWFSKDFNQHGSLTSFINPYTDIKLSENIKVTYKRYNWDLNGA